MKTMPDALIYLTCAALTGAACLLTGSFGFGLACVAFSIAAFGEITHIGEPAEDEAEYVPPRDRLGL